MVVPDLPEALQGAGQFPVWTTVALSMGVLFISIFYLMAVTAQRVGVSVTTIASKMSLALAAILFAVTDDNEHIGWIKGLAIALALAGVVLASIKSEQTKFHWNMLMWPLLILVGSTVIDFCLAHFSMFPENQSELALYSCLSFFTAAIVGILVLSKKMLTEKYTLRLRDMVAGIGLGMVNYGSIYFLVRTYDSGIFAKSTILPVNNLAVVIIGAFAAILLFKEKLEKWNWLGVAFSILALALLLWE
jgi:drug/metabolite transporter (DMT)-like permease